MVAPGRLNPSVSEGSLVSQRRKPSPLAVAEETLRLLRRNADPAIAASYQRYFKEPVEYYGIGMPARREIQQRIVERVRETWSLQDAVRFCRMMLKDPHLEPRGLGFQIVARFAGESTPGMLPEIKRWLERSCGNWGLVDNLAPSVLAPLIEKHPELIPEVVSWTRSSNQWVRRGATVAFVPLVRKKKGQKRYLSAAYRVASRLLDDEEDLMHKAVGWLLREAGKADMERLERFLLDKGPRIPRTTVRYAIERFPEADRRRLLESTRGKAPARRTSSR